MDDWELYLALTADCCYSYTIRYRSLIVLALCRGRRHENRLFFIVAYR